MAQRRPCGRDSGNHRAGDRPGRHRKGLRRKNESAGLSYHRDPQTRFGKNVGRKARSALRERGLPPAWTALRERSLPPVRTAFRERSLPPARSALRERGLPPAWTAFRERTRSMAWMRWTAFCPRADVVALSLPGNPSTRHVLNRERIGLLNPNAIVLNVGRGTAIDTDALCDALYGGRIAGAALDVTDPEPTAGGPSPLGCAPHPDHPSYFRRLFPAGNAGADLRHLRGKSGTFPEGRTASERGGYGDRVRFRTACAVNAQTWLKRNGTFHGTGDRTKCSMNFCRKKFCRIFRGTLSVGSSTELFRPHTVKKRKNGFSAVQKSVFYGPISGKCCSEP